LKHLRQKKQAVGMVDVNSLGMEMDKEQPVPPAELFHSNIAKFWQTVSEYSPSKDDSSTEIWLGIKWSLSMSVGHGKTAYDLVTITGKYTFDESWTEAFATARNAEEWKKQLTEHIQTTASKQYKVKIDIAGNRRPPAKGDGTILVTITWTSPPTQPTLHI